MSNMFISYDHIPDNYIPDNIHPVNDLLYVPQQRPLVEYNAKGNFIGFSWHYKDHIVLEFVTTGIVKYDNAVYEEAEDYLRGKVFEITLYNFRYEAFCTTYIEASSDCEVAIEDELAASMVPGVYYMSVTLIDSINNIRQTLLDYDELKFIVR